MGLKKGDTVKQKAVVITGAIADVAYNADSGHFQYLVEYTDADGNVAQRWFDETDVEVV